MSWHAQPIRHLLQCAGVDLKRSGWSGVQRRLIERGVRQVALESTGVYWIPVFELLERRGLSVHLVDARATKQVSGRKSDVRDCEWIQQLMSCGLLRAAFRPADSLCELRALVRLRSQLVRDGARAVQHMKKKRWCR